MKPGHSSLLLFALALCGTAFSGYLSAHRYLTQTCALEEPCPLVGGTPACYIGFALFAALLVVQTTTLVRRSARTLALVVTAVLAGVGTVFAVYVSASDMQSLWTSASGYVLALPSCVYGGVLFAVIQGVAAATLARRQPPRRSLTTPRAAT